MLSRQGGDIVGGGCIDTGSDETSIAELVDDTLRTRKVVVRNHVPREEVAPGSDLRSCRAHSSGTHHEDGQRCSGHGSSSAMVMCNDAATIGLES